VFFLILMGSGSCAGFDRSCRSVSNSRERAISCILLVASRKSQFDLAKILKPSTEKMRLTDWNSLNLTLDFFFLSPLMLPMHAVHRSGHLFSRGLFHVLPITFPINVVCGFWFLVTCRETQIPGNECTRVTVKKERLDSLLYVYYE